MTLTDCTLPEMPAYVKHLYESAFPVEERRVWAPRPEGLRLRIARDENARFLGFITSWQLPDAITYVEHLAVMPELRGSGIGGEIIDALTGKIILEVELPNSPAARRRIDFYERHGFKAAHDVDYVQPPYQPGLPEVPMMLMCRGDIDAADAALKLHSIVYGV